MQTTGTPSSHRAEHDAYAAVVSGLLIKPIRHHPMEAVEAAQAKAREGFIGDCHAERFGPRQLLIVREESLEDLGVAPWQVRANVATRGLPEEALVSGSVLQLGSEIRIRVTHVCEVCKVLRQYVSADTFRVLPRRRGSLAVVLTGGSVALGDAVTVVDERYPEVPEGIYERLEWILARVPEGRVVTYDTLLSLLGVSRPYFRVLPTYLKRADAVGLPAHRVLTSAGEVGGHLPGQKRRLQAEGVRVSRDGALTENVHRWHGEHLYLNKH
jgi:alkylated DNA nucleotide flippase Atl1